MLSRFVDLDRMPSAGAYIRRHAGEGRGYGTHRGQPRGPGRVGSQLLRVDLVEFGVVEQQAAPFRQASDVAIVMLPANVVS
jgi:hypothetical protein